MYRLLCLICSYIAVSVSLEHVITDSPQYDRVVAIGDLHGSFIGLKEILYAAGITSEADRCEWKDQEKPFLLVQTGDILDRGPAAVEIYDCLRTLQKQASNHNARVVRLLGNHEQFWLENILSFRNPQSDTPQVVTKVINGLVEEISSGDVVGAFYYEHVVRGNVVPVLFTHAGISPEYYAYLEKTTNLVETVSSGSMEPARFIANHISSEVKSAIAKSCSEVVYQNPSAKIPKCLLSKEMVFAAGKERGGGPVGGPIWSDFSVMEASAANGFYDRKLPGVVQVVGHTMANCYAKYLYERTGTHPLSTENDCAKGLLRLAKSHSGYNGICIDAGIFMGARAFLSLHETESSTPAAPAVEFTAHQHAFADSPDSGGWVRNPLAVHAFPSSMDNVSAEL